MLPAAQLTALLFPCAQDQHMHWVCNDMLAADVSRPLPLQGQQWGPLGRRALASPGHR